MKEKAERLRFAQNGEGMKACSRKTECTCVNESNSCETVRLQETEGRMGEDLDFLGSTVHSNKEWGEEVEISGGIGLVLKVLKSHFDNLLSYF